MKVPFTQEGGVHDVEGRRCRRLVCRRRLDGLQPRGSAAPAAGALAHEETKGSGVSAEVTEFRRKGNTLTAQVRFRNRGTADAEPDIKYEEVYLMDAGAGKKYSVLKDENGAYIAGLRQGWKDRWYHKVPPGQDMVIWAKFPAPPPEVKAVTLQLPGVPPFDDLAIQDF